MKKDNKLFLGHIRENIREIKKSVKSLSLKEFSKKTEKKLANLRRLEIIGEATKNLSQEYKRLHPDIPWRNMAALRDVIIHNYYEIQEDIIWNVIQNELPDLDSPEYDPIN